VIYINGDSHSAGAEIINDHCFAEDDKRFTALGKRPHPENIPYTFGYKLANALNLPFWLDAESASSNDRIIRTTRKAISGTINKQNMFIIIGWATFEREEWQYKDGYIQISASGIDSVPEELKNDYREWVTRQTEQVLDEKTKMWHDKIYDFHLELQEQNIKHLFFNTYIHFKNIENKVDWDNQFIDPYSQDETYFYWCKNKQFKTRNNGYHYGADAHNEYFLYLLDIVKDQFVMKTGLTDMPKRSIFTKVKEKIMRQ
jgi:hypothetical protein